MSSTFHARGIVLKREDWRDAGRLYTLYTLEAGKLLAVGRGTRKSVSKLAAHLEPYSSCELHLARGRKMETICGAVLSRSSEPISFDEERHLVAAFIAETSDHFIKFGDPDPGTWQLIDGALAAVGQVPLERLGAIASLFAWRLMDRLGYHPRLDECASCERATDEGLFLPARGVLLCADCRPPERELSGAEPLDRAAVAGIRTTLEGRVPSEGFARAAVAGAAFLEAHLDRPINTLPQVRERLLGLPHALR